MGLSIFLVRLVVILAAIAFLSLSVRAQDLPDLGVLKPFRLGMTCKEAHATIKKMIDGQMPEYGITWALSGTNMEACGIHKSSGMFGEGLIAGYAAGPIWLKLYESEKKNPNTNEGAYHYDLYFDRGGVLKGAQLTRRWPDSGDIPFKEDLASQLRLRYGVPAGILDSEDIIGRSTSFVWSSQLQRQLQSGQVKTLRAFQFREGENQVEQFDQIYKSERAIRVFARVRTSNEVVSFFTLIVEHSGYSGEIANELLRLDEERARERRLKLVPRF